MTSCLSYTFKASRQFYHILYAFAPLVSRLRHYFINKTISFYCQIYFKLFFHFLNSVSFEPCNFNTYTLIILCFLTASSLSSV